MGLENTIERYERGLWLSDAHTPFQDKRTIKAVIAFLRNEQPDYVIFGGDMIDFYSISRFDKDPDRTMNLQQELDVTRELLEQIVAASPDSKFIYVPGNHEYRLTKYLWTHEEIASLRALELPNLLGLKELGIEYMDEWMYKEFLFKHGDYTNKYHANKELDVEGISGMSGHNHRNQIMSKTTRQGQLTWYSVGHLADVDQADYIKNPNWQQGIAMIYIRKNTKDVHVQLIEIHNHRFVYNGVEYQG